MRPYLLPALVFFIVPLACGSTRSGQNDSTAHPSAGAAGTSAWDYCNSVRLTWYPAGDVAWCEFDRKAPMLPEFVRNGLTLAVAEPWDGSSYGGDPGEACGECWEITSLYQTKIVMVHDLCPIEGNPLCTGSHFDFDLSLETGNALGLEGLDEGRARRVPCPVTGNVFLSVLGRDQWGSLRFQVINQRLPVRSIQYREAGANIYYSAERSAAAWAVSNDHRQMFAPDGRGGSFRLTSAQGEVVEMPNVLTYGVPVGAYFDLGAQFTDQRSVTGGQCQFLPPKDVYVDGYGGIEAVQWMMNPWGGALPSEVTSGCVSGSCLRIDAIQNAVGFHIYYRESFPPTTFKTLHFSARTAAGVGTLWAMPTSNDASCSITTITVGESWTEWNLDLATVCAGVPAINAVTFNGLTPMTLFLDNVRFEP